VLNKRPNDEDAWMQLVKLQEKSCGTLSSILDKQTAILEKAVSLNDKNERLIFKYLQCLTKFSHYNGGKGATAAGKFIKYFKQGQLLDKTSIDWYLRHTWVLPDYGYKEQTRDEAKEEGLKNLLRLISVQIAATKVETSGMA